MKTFLAALVFVGLAVLLLGVNIFLFRRPFPNGDIATNPEMQKRGIKCAKQEELELCKGKYSDACKSCPLAEESARKGNRMQ